MCGLHEMRRLGSTDREGFRLVARGKVLPAVEGGRAEAVELGECVDWCIDYSEPPGLWLVSPHAW